MIIIFALASLVLVLGSAMRVEVTAAANRLAAQEASAVARGAEQYVLALLTETPSEVELMEETEFEAVPIGRGYFWILRPDYNDPTLPIYGLTDESGRIDINTASYESLRLLPGMTDEIAGAIIDWRDPDDTVSENGAESQAYLSLTEPYRAKNEPFETVEELRLVSGMTKELLHGIGQGMPLGEGAGSIFGSSDRPFGSEQYQIRGLGNYFTIWSRQPIDNPDGEPRIPINSQQQRLDLRQLLRDQLGEARGSEVGGRIGGGNMMDIFDFALRLQLEPSELESIEDYITDAPVPQGQQQPQPPRGRINVNTAAREVLLCLEGLTESDVDALLARRPAAIAAKPTSVAWVLDVLEEKAIGLGTRITGRGTVYSADIMAASGNGRAFKRVRIVVDAAEAPLRIIYRRDLTDQGWPLDRSILDALRRGEAPAAAGGLGMRY